MLPSITYSYGSLEQYKDYSDNQDYKKLIQAIIVFAIAALLAGVVYAVTKNTVIAAGVAGITYAMLTFYSIPFVLMWLFALLAIENAIVLSPYFTISKVAGVILLLSFVTHMFRTKVSFPSICITALLLVVWAGLSAAWAIESALFVVLLWLSLVLDLGLIVIMANVINTKQVLFIICCGFIVGALIAALLVVGGQAAPLRHRAAEVGRVQLHEETDPVILGYSLAIGVIVLIHVIILKGISTKVLAIVPLLLVFYALFKTQSRTPILCAVLVPVGAFIMCSSRGKRLRYLLAAILVFAAGSISLKLLYESDILSSTAKKRLVGGGLAVGGRLYFWSNAVEYFLERPITGWGLGNYAARAEKKGHGIDLSAHNNIFAIMADLGGVGLVLFMVLLIQLLWATIKIDDLKLRWLAMGMLLYAFMSGMTVVNYFKKNFWYALGITIVAISLAKYRTKQQQGPAELDYAYYDQADSPDYMVEHEAIHIE